MSGGGAGEGAARGKKRRGLKGTGEIDLLPLMGVFLVLLPLLLVGAVFDQITTIEMSLPADAASVSPLLAAPRDTTTDADLTLRIEPSYYEIRAKATEPRRVSRNTPGSDTELKAALGAVKGAFPAAEEVVIVSPPTARYEELVRLMDIARAAGWPQAALTGMLDPRG